MNEKLAIILPCYNEEEVLPLTIERLATLTQKLNERQVQAQLVFVDDGSTDNTWQLIEAYCKERPNVSGVKLAHNAGHQRCLWAGMTETAEKFDAIVTIDADLQDDENTIVDMMEQYRQGCDVVYGIRKRRNTDTFFKRFTAKMFYKVIHAADKEMLDNHADFRLMSQRAVKALLQYPERNIYLRGLVRTLGFKQGFVYYDRTPRTAGDTKYPMSKMAKLAVDGITSFSTAPLRFIAYIGMIISVLAFIAIIAILIEYIGDLTIEWRAITLSSLWFLGGVILTTIGVMGLYVGRIYEETKQRPHYILDRCVNL
ncbi:MAG: glycosyltransferase family 2 protein [Bacteroidaceae bacterium]|nr:glycosyltransferase family 2 protein [Bacteroidaceae bacterium]